LPSFHPGFGRDGPPPYPDGESLLSQPCNLLEDIPLFPRTAERLFPSLLPGWTFFLSFYSLVGAFQGTSKRGNDVAPPPRRNRLLYYLLFMSPCLLSIFFLSTPYASPFHPSRYTPPLPPHDPLRSVVTVLHYTCLLYLPCLPLYHLTPCPPLFIPYASHFSRSPFLISISFFPPSSSKRVLPPLPPPDRSLLLMADRSLKELLFLRAFFFLWCWAFPRHWLLSQAHFLFFPSRFANNLSLSPLCRPPNSVFSSLGALWTGPAPRSFSFFPPSSVGFWCLGRGPGPLPNTSWFSFSGIFLLATKLDLV